jgi:hypothetical protein
MDINPISKQTKNRSIRENRKLNVTFKSEYDKLRETLDQYYANNQTPNCLCNYYWMYQLKKDTKIVEDPVVFTYYFIRHSEKDRTDPDKFHRRAAIPGSCSDVLTICGRNLPT